MPYIDWSSLSLTRESPRERFVRIAKAAVQPVDVYFSGAGANPDYDASSPLGRKLTWIGHELDWANDAAAALVRSYVPDPVAERVAIARHGEDKDDLHVLSLTPWIPDSPFFDVTTDRARAEAVMPAGGALYQTTVLQGNLLATPYPGAFLLPGHVSTPFERIA